MPTPVIIDTDPGVDDIIAILFALASPELEIVAYSVSFGNTDVDAAYLNVLKAYNAVERHVAQFPNFRAPRKPILARGPAAPLHGDIHSAQYFHGRDGLGDIDVRHVDLSDGVTTEAIGHPHFEVSSASGVDVALEILKNHPPRSVTYIALGPLTNLALMMQKDHKLVIERIGRVVSMGGAVDVPGNTSPVAEFNYFADPFAVKELLLSPAPGRPLLPLDRFLMLPLDITTPHEIPFPVYKRVIDPAFHGTDKPSQKIDKPPVTHFTSAFLEKTREIMLLFGKDAMELHDIVAVWCAIAHPPVIEDGPPRLAPQWKAETRMFDIERTGELTRGMLVVDRREDEAAFPLGATRSEAQRDESDLIPIQKKDLKGGVWCVTDTPGPDALLSLLFERIWGVKISGTSERVSVSI